MNTPTPKHYRKFGPVTITSGKEVKTIYGEQNLRIRKDTGEVLLDKEGRTMPLKNKKENVSGKNS